MITHAVRSRYRGGAPDKGRAVCILALFALLGMAQGATAQPYPSRPVTLIVPFAAGGPTDVLARIIVEPMRAALGQPVVIENVGGAAGNIALNKVVREKPDGYTAIIGNWGTHVVNGAVQTLQHDLLKDFEPVGLIATNPHVIVSRSTVPAKDLKELITWVKENQDKLTAANSGTGSPSHISGLYFQSKTGTRFPFVPYRGSGPALQDLVAGQIDLYFDQVSNSLPHIRGGKSRPMRWPPHRASRRRRTFRPSTRRGCPAFISRCGTRSGSQRARPRTSSQNSTRRS